jgi:WhiB family redox-sensing transcriptional regulator
MIVDLVLTDEAEEWQAEALCAETDPEAFFPEKGGSTRAAKSICNGSKNAAPCPVKDQCLAYALEHDERFGIWGGLAERERRSLKRAQDPMPRAPQPPPTHGTAARAQWDRRHGATPCEACLQAERDAHKARAEARAGNTVIVTEKLCRDCGVTKPADQFNRKAERVDGLYPYCRDCSSAHYRDWYDRVGRASRGRSRSGAVA